MNLFQLLRAQKIGLAADKQQHQPVERPTAAELHELYLAKVFHYVSRRLPSREEAEDVTAEVFKAAFESLPTYQKHSSISAWLLGIARRKVADALRRHYRHPVKSLSELLREEEEGSRIESRAPTEAEPEAWLQRSEARNLLFEMVMALKEEQREALLLHYIEEMRIAEIGVVMGRSEGAVSSLLQRARANLYQKGKEYFLDKEGGKDESK